MLTFTFEKLNSINFEWNKSVSPQKSKEEKAISSVSSDVTSNNKAEIETLIEENTNLIAKQAELEAKIKVLSNKNEDLESELKELQNKYDSLLKRVEANQTSEKTIISKKHLRHQFKKN